MKKNKLLIPISILGILPTTYLPLVSCNSSKEVSLSISCDKAEQSFSGEKVTFTFSSNKDLQKDELKLVVNNEDVTLNSFSVDGKKIVAIVNVNTNKTTKINFDLTINYGQKFSQIYSLSIDNVPLPTYKVKFVSNDHINFDGGAKEIEISISKGETIASSLPKYTVDSGYVFGGWYVDDEEVSQNYIIKKETKIVAKAAKVTSSAYFDYEITSSSVVVIKGYTGTEKQVYIPNKIKDKDVKVIDEYAFNKNSTITKVVLPSQLDQINKYAFNECTSLKIVSINALLRKIEAAAFVTCTNLESVTCENDKAIWTKYDSTHRIVGQIIPAETNFTNILKTANYGDRFEYKEFTNDTWDNVVGYANQGINVLHNAYDVKSLIGAERLIKLNNITHRVRVVGECHDTIAGSDNKATLTFELCELYTETSGTPFTLNYSNLVASIQTDGYIGSDLYKILSSEGSIYKAFETGNPGLLDNIKEVKKDISGYKKVDEEITSIESSYQAKLFPLSYTEITGYKASAMLEGSQYPYWNSKTESERKKVAVGGDKSFGYWLCSPTHYLAEAKKGASGAYSINKDGHADRSSHLILYDKSNGGVSFAFCIGQND